MRYIKEYNKWDKIGELSEYLQEIFDEFNIRYKDYGVMVNEQDFYWDIVSGCIYITMYSDRSDRSKYYELQKKLEQKLEFLENRLGTGINIEYWDDEIEISVG